MNNDWDWNAKWIWKPRSESTQQEGKHEIVYFRREFELTLPDGCQLLARVSADSRYRLYMNGELVSMGPCKGDRFTHYFETVDLSEHLVSGTNVIAAQVLHYTPSEPFTMGIGGPASVWRSNTGVFLFDGMLIPQDGTASIPLHSNDEWVYVEDEAIRFHPGELETLYVGGVERVEGSLIPIGWETLEFDACNWKHAIVVANVIDTEYGQLTPWTLAPRPIPALYETHKGFVGIKFREGGGTDEPKFHTYLTAPSADGFRIEPKERFIIELDAGELLTGYLFMELTGGRGASVTLLCSECYEDIPESTIRRNKGVRDDAINGCLIGEKDIYKVAGYGETFGEIFERYEPFSFRTFRYIRLEIETNEQPLTIHRLNFRETGYPLEVKADFQSSDPSLLPLWNISINTLKRCMHETYEDCPYYEQLQYIMDTRLQALFTYQLSADDRLAKRAIFDFHSSMLPNGMLQSRYPSMYPQVIPGFSLYWIMMIHDHYCYFADLSLVRQYLSTIDAVLEWFDRQITEDGLVGRIPPNYWSFVDWVDEWRDNYGVPHANENGPLTVYSLMYVAALNTAAELNNEAGRTATAEEYRNRAASVKQAVRKSSWSEKNKLFRDGPTVEQYSQHAQVWAVISETVQGEEAQQLIDMLLETTSLPKVSYAMSFFMFRAFSKTGRYNESFYLFDVWRQLADLKLTTWVEDPVSQRSDCHGWGAVPIYEFTTEILGVKSDGFGFRKIIVAPQLGELTWAKGTVATPVGTVHVEWELKEDGIFSIRIDSPESIPLTLESPNGERIEWKGGGFHETRIDIHESGKLIGQ